MGPTVGVGLLLELSRTHKNGLLCFAEMPGPNSVFAARGPALRNRRFPLNWANPLAHCPDPARAGTQMS